MSGRIQSADIKTVAELVANGATKSSLPQDSQVYASAIGDYTLAEAIEAGLINDFPPLRLYASATPDAKLNISPSAIPLANGGAKALPPFGAAFGAYPQTSINFQTGAITGGVVVGTIPSTTSGEFRRVGFTYGSDNKVYMVWSAAAASVGALAGAQTLVVAGGVSLGYVDLEGTGTTTYKTAGSATNVIENAVSGTARIVCFLASVDSQIAAYFGQMRLSAHATDASRVRLSGADVTLFDGSVRGQVIKNIVMNFAGASIDFTGANAGSIYNTAEDTVIGTFTAVTPALNQYRWYSVAMIPDTVGSDNRITIQMNIAAASADGASIAAAPRADYPSNGNPVGQFCVQNVGGTVVLSQLFQLGSGAGGSGTSSSGGGAAKSPADGFQAIVSDAFDVGPTAATTKVDSTNTKATYSTAKQLYALACDKAPTITIVGTAVTLSVAPSFTVQVGDILWVNSLNDWARISAVSSQTSLTIDFTIGNVTTAAGMVSQAVWTQNLVNYGSATEKTRLRDFFANTANLTAHLEYSDSLIAGDITADQVDAARIVASISNNGLQADTGLPTSDKFGGIVTRPAAPSQILDVVLPSNTNKERLIICFFANPNNASVTSLANLINYDISLYAETTFTNGGYLNSAFTLSDGSLAYNTSAPSLVGGNTRLTLGWDFIPGVNAGSPDGDIEVVVDGSIIPRFFTGVVGTYWKEVTGSTRTIEINGDLTVLSPAISIHVRRRQGTLDSSTQNVARIGAMFDAVVGSASDVTTGRAQYSSVSSALAAVQPGASILLLNSAAAESVVVNKAGIVLQGRGYNGLMTSVTVSADYCDVSSVRATNWTVSGNHNFVRGWIPTANTPVNSGTDNAMTIITL